MLQLFLLILFMSVLGLVGLTAGAVALAVTSSGPSGSDGRTPPMFRRISYFALVLLLLGLSLGWLGGI